MNKLLAVEDDITQQYVLRVVLESFGMRADIVSSGEEALDFLFVRPNSYSVVLMDIRLPGMDGFDCTREIRKRQAKNRFKIVIIAVTAYASAEDRKLCLDSGMDDYMSKPYQLDAFRKLIEKYLVQQHGYDEHNQEHRQSEEQHT
jgi:CheY-like chemotaxis protein